MTPNLPKIKPRMYLIHIEIDNTILVKVGISINTYKRVKQLQLPKEPFLVEGFNFETIEKAKAFEKYFLDLFSSYRSNGEWLYIPKSEYSKFDSSVIQISELIEGLGVGTYCEIINNL